MPDAKAKPKAQAKKPRPRPRALAVYVDVDLMAIALDTWLGGGPSRELKEVMKDLLGSPITLNCLTLTFL